MKTPLTRMLAATTSDEVEEFHGKEMKKTSDEGVGFLGVAGGVRRHVDVSVVVVVVGNLVGLQENKKWFMRER